MSFLRSSYKRKDSPSFRHKNKEINLSKDLLSTYGHTNFLDFMGSNLGRHMYKHLLAFLGSILQRKKFGSRSLNIWISLHKQHNFHKDKEVNQVCQMQLNSRAGDMVREGIVFDLFHLLNCIIRFCRDSKFFRLDINNDQHWIWNIAATPETKIKTPSKADIRIARKER